jgi:glycosyltransferase involved in cell wall biosynthesis
MATLDLARPATAAGPASARIHVLPASPPATIPTVDVVIPVYNEEATLELSVRCLDAFLARDFPLSARITIVDNASTDRTWVIAQRLRDELPRVEALHLDDKGRGRALRAAWSTSDAPILAYMDVDLSTDLRALLPLVDPLLDGRSDIAIGSRLLPQSRVRRGLKRELISRCYNRLLHTVLGSRFHDAQCGFKALRAEAAQRLLHRIDDQGWFFDTELLVRAERLGMRIHEVPVDWNEDPDSRVNILATALTDLRGIARVRRTLGRDRRRAGGHHRTRRGGTPRAYGSFVHFAAVGIISTIAYAVLYAVLRSHLAPAPSNAIALLATAIANTEANRRFTFGVRVHAGRVRDHIGGLAAFGLALGITTSALEAMALVNPAPSRATEVTVLLMASMVATIARFVLLGSLLTARTRG